MSVVKNILRVVWLCNISSLELQAILRPFKCVGEIAPWISSLTNFFEDQDDIELHIISPHEYITNYKSFKKRNIYYHFFNAHIPCWGRHWPGLFKFDYWTDFVFTKKKVRKIINKIKPDIIHLHGAENAYYSSSIMQFREEYPVFITIQGFISHTNSKKYYQVRKRINYEQKILKSFKHFGYRTYKMGEDIRVYNPKAFLHWHQYPFPEIVPLVVKKKYDFVFFGRITKDKGIEDLLKAISKIKKDKTNVSICIIGGANSKYLEYLKKQTSELNINENVFWAGFLPTQKEVHQLASSACISVLPTYHDIISGTIIESMFIKLPVVAYNTGSIHEINDNFEYITLVKKGDIIELAIKLSELLLNQKKLRLIAEKSLYRAKEMFSNEHIVYDLKKAYESTISEFYSEFNCNKFKTV